ncbi:MAG: O-antigen ligase family protein, partial [bacterium]|nr:O-antigen ligase family protein [bacterium]
QKFAQVIGGTRFIFWDSALAGFKDRPLLGWGPNTFSEVYHRHFSPDIFLPENKLELLVDKPHNLFFETLAAGGLTLFIALCAFLVSIILIFWRLTKRKRLLGSLLIGAFVAWLIQMQFIFDSVASLALLALVIGIGLADGTPDDRKRGLSAPIGVREKAIMVLASVIILFLFIYAIALPMKKAYVMFGVRNMTLPARADAWPRLSGISPMGDDYDAVITFARAYDAYSQSAKSLSSGDPFQKAIALKELDAINTYLLEILRERGDKYELILVTAQMHYVRLLIEPRALIKTWDDARSLASRAAEISPADPRPQELLKFFDAIKK